MFLRWRLRQSPTWRSKSLVGLEYVTTSSYDDGMNLPHLHSRCGCLGLRHVLDNDCVMTSLVCGEELRNPIFVSKHKFQIYLVMEAVNKEIATRVSAVLDQAIQSLKEAYQTPTRLIHHLTLLRDQTKETLSLTLQQDESLRADIRRFDCEQSTKNDDLRKQRARLINVREERNERRKELEYALTTEKKIFEEKKAALLEQQSLKLEREEVEMKKLQTSFDEELKTLQEKRDELRKQYQEQREHHAEEEAKLREKSELLDLQIQQLSNEHTSSMNAKETELGVLRTLFHQQMSRRLELEKHFARVDENNAVKQREEDALMRVAESEQAAHKLLDDGAMGLQNLWRGVRDRALVAKLKASKKKKGKGKKGGKKK